VADFRPFPALRYNPDVAGKASDLIAPPYDVVSSEQAAALRARSSHNISIVDYGEARPGDTASDNRYARARTEIARWLVERALVRDERPRLYVYDQVFSLRGETRKRRTVFGRLRLEEWEKGIVLPHEHTRSAAKADRLELLRATRVHLSPIMGMYRSPTSKPLTDEGDFGPVLLDAVLPGERHVLRPLGPEAAAYLQRHLENEKLYIADGHHRYETALNYRNERRDASPGWSGDEPENFVLAAVVDIDDPGWKPFNESEAGPHRLLLRDNEAFAILVDDGIAPTVRGLLAFPASRRAATVDMGAIRFIYNGADVMAPGIIDADPGIRAGDLVWVRDERNRQPLAIGRAIMDGPTMSREKRGKAIETLHHVGDDLWHLGEEE